MPLTDLKWCVEQYYPAVCQYIHCPKEQNEMSRRFHFHKDLWQADFEKNTFVIAEDEFNNIFEMSRTFAARTQKGFINILSENYMLREYMCDNSELFTKDSKAIPSIVPDYARTQRNFVLRTLMLMAASPVDESELSRELSLHGCETKNTYQKMCELIETHLGIKDFHIQTLREYVGIGGNRYSKFMYQVDKSLVESVFDAALKSAYYVVENEKVETYPMGNRLMGHIEQVILPGQFFCYDGKYYQARSISAKNGIIVRRAAEHLDGRVYYRQLRKYGMNIISEREDAQEIRGMKLQNICADIVVETDGYLELKSRNLLTEATMISLDSVRKRTIPHKEALRVSIPSATEQVRFTICVLLNELFHTIYPNESGYIVAAPGVVSKEILENPEYNNVIRSLVPSLDIAENASESIYFIEDSCIDLGLLISIERNFQRLFEILYDYLDWYLEKDEADDSYLFYGHDDVPDWLNLEETYQFLKENQFDDSNIHRSRKRKLGFDEESNYDPNQLGVHYCDFCGKELEKGNYDVLKDGRERCPECSNDAVKNRKYFKQIYQETLSEMKRIFGISIEEKIKVQMVNAKKVNDIPGEEFVPTPQFDRRVLGYAQKTSKGYKLLVESGAPKWKMKSTLVHELTHIWQYSNWSDEEVTKHYPDGNSKELLYEGMAVWVELQYLMAMGQKNRAIMYKRNRDADSSVYGVGMKAFLDHYPMKAITNLDDKETPFKKFPPI